MRGDDTGRPTAQSLAKLVEALQAERHGGIRLQSFDIDRHIASCAVAKAPRAEPRECRVDPPIFAVQLGEQGSCRQLRKLVAAATSLREECISRLRAVRVVASFTQPRFDFAFQHQQLLFKEFAGQAISHVAAR